MKQTETPLYGVHLLQYNKFADERGYFLESFNIITMARAGLKADFLQDNHSHSWHGVLRGLHFSLQPQYKLVRVVRGSVFDVVVDTRKASRTYGQWWSTVLCGDDATALYIPPGVAHGFYVNSDYADVVYKTSCTYDPESERTLLWNDPDVAVNWGKISPILSAKDAVGRRLKDL